MMAARTKFKTGLWIVLSLALLAVATREAFALRFGAAGNTPIQDPGWPDGAAKIFNTPSRIAHWTGDGHPYYSECRGDATAFSAVLADFAKLEVKSKSIVLRDGIGKSYWLDATKEGGKAVDAKMDWVFKVWAVGNGNRARGLNAPRNSEPPCILEVYTGGNIRWPDVVVPAGLIILDERLESHGFKLTDGVVLEGLVTDPAAKKPIGAKVKLEKVEQQPKGGYRYSLVAETKADADGHWVLKKVPAGWQRVVIESDGFVARVAGYVQVDEQPRWQEFNCGLSRPGSLSGRVTDDAGRPLADVEVSLDSIMTELNGRYETPGDHAIKTGADGQFRAEQVPIGQTTLWVRKSGYFRPGLGLPVTTPKDGITLVMLQAARAVITVDFTGKVRPAGYIVMIEPEGGNVIGSWGGSGQIDTNNKITFENAPPGAYVIRGRPNPGAANQETTPITIQLNGGKTGEFTLNAK
jgi:Carboxypeptidase regulatory-like domain